MAGTFSLGANWSTGTYDYDGAWNIHQIGNTEFRYDRFHRLVEGQVDVGTIKSQKAAYDSYGNLTSLDTAGAIQTLSPNGSTNRLSGVTYDVAGNTRQITLAGTTFQYGFEAAGQLEFLKSNANQAKVFTYDAAGERLLTWDCPLNSCGPNSALERWTLRGLGGEVLRVFEGKSSAELTMKEDFIYRGGQTLAAVRPTAAGGEETFAIHLDHLGSTRQVTSEAGTEVERHDFYPFGEEATVAQAGDIPLKFTGHERDRNGGGKGMLDYMHARSCSPLTGRFLSVDPLKGSALASRPQSWNRYSYVVNNPLKFADKTGLLWFGDRNSLQYFRGVESVSIDISLPTPTGSIPVKIVIKGFRQAVSFNGYTLTLHREDGSTRTFPAVAGNKATFGLSGRSNSNTQQRPDIGPLPEGQYSFKTQDIQNFSDLSAGQKTLAAVGRGSWPGGRSSWGNQRVWLTPSPDNEMFGRSNFTIHGGDQPGSRGCIDLCKNADSFFAEIDPDVAEIPVFVNYQ